MMFQTQLQAQQMAFMRIQQGGGGGTVNVNGGIMMGNGSMGMGGPGNWQQQQQQGMHQQPFRPPGQFGGQTGMGLPFAGQQQGMNGMMMSHQNNGRPIPPWMTPQQNVVNGGMNGIVGDNNDGPYARARK